MNEFIKVSRAAELRFLEQTLSTEGPDVVGLYGIAGVGKSTLTNYFFEHNKESCISIDCQTVEPTPKAFIEKLRTLIDCNSDELTVLRSAFQKGTVLILDQFESFNLIESWVRTEFVPAMLGQLKLIISGRLHPDNQWIINSPVNLQYCRLKLECLPLTHSVQFLQSCGLSKVQATGVNQFAHGHPVALKLASAALLEQPDRQLHELPSSDVTKALVQFFVEDIKQEELRAALEAASVVRRVSESNLAAMLGIDPIASARLYSGLEELELIESREDGLTPHEILRTVLSSSLKARTPVRYTEYRRRASQALLTEIKQASSSQLWRYTADILYLVDNGVIRNAFFPPDDQREYSVLPASTNDQQAVMNIISEHEPKSALAIYVRWWSRHLETFHCVKNSADEIVGFYCLIKPTNVSEELLQADPMTNLWHSHSQQNRVTGQSIFIRRWLSKDLGENLCGIQAACWLDIKRTYLEMRPQLRQVYLTLNNLQPYASVATELGFQVLENSVDIDDKIYYSAMLDMGPESVDGWISSRLIQEIKLESAHQIFPEWFNTQAKQLCLNNQSVDLTPLEFGTLELLIKNKGVAIPRKELLKEVWGIEYEGASNVVDTIVLSLRKKLKERSTVIHSVRGTGYKYNDDL
ncbi:winged helix-turn-helix domain-containing protein [Vibrio kyushuensis]|uniref:winged helix-turn-helix domain-containing protein n=1 Tax=Vibrio kyushuensis TaxID=2910249 RepID=UPI003D0BD8DB